MIDLDGRFESSLSLECKSTTSQGSNESVIYSTYVSNVCVLPSFLRIRRKRWLKKRKKKRKGKKQHWPSRQRRRGSIDLLRRITLDKHLARILGFLFFFFFFSFPPLFSIGFFLSIHAIMSEYTHDRSTLKTFGLLEVFSATFSQLFRCRFKSSVH